MKRKILILFGGKSNEYEVSCLSAASILKAIDEDKYEVHKIGIDRGGSWFYTCAETEQIEDGSWIEEKNKPVSIQLTEDTGIYIRVNDKLTKLNIDCCFPIIHGAFGEDGRLQGMLDILNVKYVGCGTLSSAISMDKAMTKKFVEKLGDINQAKYKIIDENDFEENKDSCLNEIELFFDKCYPIFVKPANSGSSVGVTKVRAKSELMSALNLAFTIDCKVVVEEMVTGREIEIGILGNGMLKVSDGGEVISSNDIYDYEAKYISNASITKMARDLPEDTRENLKKQAALIYRTLGCRGLARVDFFVSDDGSIVFNEINTMPGFTKNSMYPRLLEDSGISYGMLIDKLIELGMEDK